MRGALFVLAVGCGRLRFDARGDGGAGGGGGDALGDGVAMPDACNFGPWSAPVHLASLSSSSGDGSPELAADGLTLYFGSARTAATDLFVAVRPDRASAFGAPMNLGSINSSSLDSDATRTDDQLDMLFTSSRTGAMNCIYESIRTDTAAAWPAPTEHTELCPSGTPITGGSISADGLTLYYNTQNMFGVLGALMIATRSARGAAFATNVPLPHTGTTQLEGFPSVSRDGLTLYFASSTPTTQLYVATRSDTTQAFGAPALLPFTGTQGDGDPAISVDGTELYFASMRGGGLGGNDLYVVTRSCL